MGVHVPEARYQVLTVSIDDLAGFWSGLGAGSDAGDAVVVDGDGGVGMGLSGDGVDNRGVGDGEGLCSGAEGQKAESNEGSHKLMVLRRVRHEKDLWLFHCRIQLWRDWKRQIGSAQHEGIIGVSD